MNLIEDILGVSALFAIALYGPEVLAIMGVIYG